MYKLVIPDLTRKEAKEIAESFYGSMIWMKVDDGAEAYPKSVEKPVLVIKDAPEKTLKSETYLSWQCRECGFKILSQYCPDCGAERPA